MSVISQLLNILKDKIEKPIEWFAIIALVILVFEVKYPNVPVTQEIKRGMPIMPTTIAASILCIKVERNIFDTSFNCFSMGIIF